MGFFGGKGLDNGDQVRRPRERRRLANWRRVRGVGKLAGWRGRARFGYRRRQTTVEDCYKAACTIA